MIEHESSLVIAKPVGDVFAFATDLTKAPLWIESCVEMKQTSNGPKAAGAPLHYKYDQSGRRGEMDGSVVAYDPNAKWAMQYGDSMFDVEVQFRFVAEASGTRVFHRVGITPKSFMAKMMSPMIRTGNCKQIESNLAKLKQLLESGQS